MNLKVQRFPAGHKLYSDAHDNFDLQGTFGQLVDENGKLICYTLERRDTLIPEGTYPFTYYDSPANKMKVLLLSGVPGFTAIEVHIANFPHELKGCTAVGSTINVNVPQLVGSTIAFNSLMNLLAGSTGTITYETFNN